MTPFEKFCKEHGVSTDSKFRIKYNLSSSRFDKGDVIVIHFDDGTIAPAFKYPHKSSCSLCIRLEHIEPAKPGILDGLTPDQERAVELIVAVAFRGDQCMIDGASSHNSFVNAAASNLNTVVGLVEGVSCYALKSEQKRQEAIERAQGKLAEVKAQLTEAQAELERAESE